jgi:hypothetical protein
MSRLLKLASLFLVPISLTSCGYVAVSGAILTGSQTTSGVVSVVQFTFANGSSAITIVTLAGQDSANTFRFCGDQRAQFPVDTMVHASFTAGSNCDSLISVHWQ